MRHLKRLPEELDLPFWRIVQLLESAMLVEKIEQNNQTRAVQAAIASFLPKSR